MRSYKILRVVNVSYSEIFEHFVKKKEKILNCSYDELIKTFKSEHYHYLNSFEESMLNNGNLAELIIYNFEALQERWLEENQLTKFKNIKREDKLFKIFCLQLNKKRPEILLFQHSAPFDLVKLKDLKKDFPFIKKIIFHNGIPIKNKSLKYVDYIFSALPFLKKFYENQGAQSSLVYHYFDSNILSKLSNLNIYTEDLTFIGKSGALNDKNHLTRFKFLSEILKSDEINFKCHSLEKERQEFIEGNYSNKKIIRDLFLDLLRKINPNLLKLIFNKNLSKKLNNLINDTLNKEKNYFFLHQLYKNKVHKALYGMEMYEKLKKSRVVFNMHTDEANKESGNIRMFEVTGIGSCLITNDTPNIKDLFMPDQEILTYKNYDEFLSKYKEIIDNKNLQETLRAKGQMKTIKYHTTEKRVEEMNLLINQILN